jgi:hypothetical protein
VVIGASIGGGEAFERAIAAFAGSYADQNEHDHASLVAAISSGRIAAEDA